MAWTDVTKKTTTWNDVTKKTTTWTDTTKKTTAWDDVKNELSNGVFEDWTLGDNVAPDDWTYSSKGGAIAKESTIIKEGSYSAKITAGGVIGGVLYQEIHATKGIAFWRGQTVKLSAWVWCDTANEARLQIYDGVGTTNSSYHTGDSSWQYLTVSHIIDNTATEVEIRTMVSNNTIVAYFDSVEAIGGVTDWTAVSKKTTTWTGV